MQSARSFTYFFAIVIAFFSVSAFSGDEDTSTAGLWLMAKYDVDGDQQISVKEIGAKREKMFVNMDGNSDGTVSFDEYQFLDSKRRALILKARFNKLDLDQDGRVDTEEYSSYVGSFDQFDRNRDGKITSSEMTRDQLAKHATKKKAVDSSNAKCILWVCVRSSF